MINRLRAFFTDQGAILDVIRDEHADGAKQKHLIVRARQIAEELVTMAPDQTRAMLVALLSRIDLKPDCVEIKLRRRRLVELLHAQSTGPTTQAGKFDSGDILTLMMKARLQRVGREMRMLVENSDDQNSADPALLRIIARAHDIHVRLIQSTDLYLARHCQPGARYSWLHLPALGSALVCAGHCHRHRQRQEPTTTHRQEADATGTPAPNRLDRTAEAARISSQIRAAQRSAVARSFR